MKKIFAGILLTAIIASGYMYPAAVCSGENSNRIIVPAGTPVLRTQYSRFAVNCTPAVNDRPAPLDLIHVPVKIAG